MKTNDTYCFNMLKKRCGYDTLLKRGCAQKEAAKREKSMSYICCYELKGTKCLLADERNKKHLLDELLQMHGEKNWPVYVFCVTDENAYVITDTGGDTLEKEVQRTIGLFYGRYEGYLRPEKDNFLHLERIRTISRKEELIEVCLELHCLPVQMGYAHRPGDYWWSSYRTYFGGYAWPMLDCSVLLQLLSEDTEKALSEFRRLHKSQKRIHCRQ